MIKSIQKILSTIDLDFKEPLPSEYIEQNRIIQPHVSINMAGKFDFSNTPYMREIVDHLSPYSPVTHVVIEKGVRVGATFILVHNGVPYIMSERPANILLVNHTKDAARSTMEGIDNGIDGCNIRHLISKGSGVQSNSKGDTMESKYYAGGFKIFNTGGQSDSGLRQVTAQIIYIDEVDAIKAIYKASGSFSNLVEDRAKDAGDSKKIIYMSSPLLLQNSLIHELYLNGDQRIYYVPCPKCGEFIELVWNERNENNTRYGIIFDVKNSEVVENSVRYRCGKCENEFEEKKYKRDMLNNGIWTPSIEREDKSYVSYNLPALYAPTTMDNWYHFAKQYQKAFPRGGIKDDSKFQSFTNSILGKPYKAEGITLKSTKLQENRREYKIGECPFELCKKDGNGEIMILSLSCDLNGWADDGRIDYEVIGHSEKGATYSIDAGSFGTFIPMVEKRALDKEGRNAAKLDYERVKYTYKLGVENSIWTPFEEYIKKTYGKYDRKLSIIAVDVGAYTDLALAFVKRIRNMGYLILPVMGEDEATFTAQIKTETGAVYMKNKAGDVYLLNVNVIKDKLSKYVDSDMYVDDNGQVQQSQYFMNFPERDPNESKYTYRNYFAHYEAEHKILKKTEGQQDKYLWEKKRAGIQNHFWDVRVYGVFCAIYMADLICSNDNPYKVLKYGRGQKIVPKWENACRIIKEASIDNNRPLS